MVACALTGNISGEATTPLGNILGEAMRQSELKSRNPRIVDVFSSISNPSRGASKINYLRFFLVNLPRYSRVCN